jgi:hypothetical protein
MPKKARAWRTVQVEQCLVDFQERYQQTALHFDGTFTLNDLGALLARLQPQAAAAVAA